MWYGVSSPGVTPCDVCLWGYVNYVMFVPPIEAVATDWEGMGYRIYICLVTPGAHIEDR
jgi:hypothetical protein